MKIWVDDIRPAPDEYIWCRSVDDTKELIEFAEYMYAGIINGLVYDRNQYKIELIDIDHDAGEFARFGGDYIKLLDWLEETGLNYPIRIHSMNPVGVENMRRIIKRNRWTEVK